MTERFGPDRAVEAVLAHLVALVLESTGDGPPPKLGPRWASRRSVRCCGERWPGSDSVNSIR